MHCTLAFAPILSDIALGRLARTCSSPTGSGPEGSSPNETFTGRCQPPIFAYDGRMAKGSSKQFDGIKGQHGFA